MSSADKAPEPSPVATEASEAVDASPAPGSLTGMVQGVVTQTTDKVREALAHVQARLVEFDQKNQFSSKASDFMAPHLERAQEASQRIAQVAGSLRTSAEVPVSAMTAALGRGASAVTQLLEKGREYDQKFKVGESMTSVSAILKSQEAKVTAAFASTAAIFARVSEEAHAKLEGVSDGLRVRVNSQVDALGDFGSRQVKMVKDTATSLDAKYKITAQVTAAAGKASAKAKELDAAYKITDKVQDAVTKAQALDEKYKVTEGVIAAAERGKALDEKYAGGKVYEAYVYGRGLAGSVLDAASRRFSQGAAPLADGEDKSGVEVTEAAADADDAEAKADQSTAGEAVVSGAE